MNQALDEQLEQHCTALNLKQEAFDNLEYILNNPKNYEKDPDFLAGYTKEELVKVFDGFNLVTQTERFPATIKTRIGIYVKDPQDIWLWGLIPVAHYELHTTIDGEVMDDFFTVDHEKYVDDISIKYCFQEMNELLPTDYLKRNHLQYNFVSYVSLTGTLFLSRKFNSAAVFILRARQELEDIGPSKFDPDFLKAASHFLHRMKCYLIRNELIDEATKSRFS